MVNQKLFSYIEFNEADFKRHLPKLVFHSQLSLKEDVLCYLSLCKANLKKLHHNWSNSSYLLGVQTKMVDRLILFLFNHFEKEVVAKENYCGPRASLIALGGYGRGEMNLHSDIDLLFLHPKKKGAYIEQLTEKVLYLLWDLKVEVGYATRTPDESAKLFCEDVTIMTSLLDARYLIGDENLFVDLEDKIKKILVSKNMASKLVGLKLKERRERVKNYGGSVFVLEPNVKECAGGLRDLQTPLWIDKILGGPGSYENFKERELMSNDAYSALIYARNFLWRVRNELHFLFGKKNDLLIFEKQEQVAPVMGFKDQKSGILAVEEFMQNYYSQAYQVEAITSMINRRLSSGQTKIGKILSKIRTKTLDDSFRLMDGQIVVKHPTDLDDPVCVLTLFKWVQEKGYGISPETKDYLRILSARINEDFRRNSQAIILFRQMLNTYRGLGQALFAMHDVGFLDAWMPEFKKLRCRVQHDIYHIYTIDTHSIFAVEELSKLINGDYDDKFPFYKQVIGEVKKPELLTLGLFLHDIGKGEGGNHSVKGAQIAKSITERLKFNTEESQGIDFLIISHLLMPHLSQRRDLEDQELIIKFAQSVGNLDNLNMLFLLTWGDIRAVGPEAWTDWKGALLEKLYLKTKDLLLKGEYSKETAKARADRIRKAFLELKKDKYPEEALKSYLYSMGLRYFFAVELEDMEEHFLLFRRLIDGEKTVVTIVPIEKDKMNELRIVTQSNLDVFPSVTGVLLAHNINIIKADLFQSHDGDRLILVRTTDANAQMIQNEAVCQKIINSMVSILNGEGRVEELIQKRKLPDYLAKKPLQKAQTKVVIDNDVSAYYTVVDIYAHDRLGLLYDIVYTLNKQGCYIDVSKITTKVEQVSDSFYLKDIFGQKITSKEKLKQLKLALEAAINPKQEQGVLVC
ncbi:MAG: [protein-PII] uridylyltransferase [Deltaproteobacteria bacterium RIFCSPLOWO2_12_FULL_40_28]|nr:MAG: [protein-PII] uridylyltransferase [Deltaproteobacteria bacterium RIFCSPHIGHO2_02_FULL_40_28]OGQ20995.1 MAG: [protein-PII] uridylyltransferase [Deltaproteobacteria bacterium RIFCSPHIGHO2_12_FULL_40_32]OGQ39396.1 MAG: [protein-PII] uridylyltransferase [Deltaproteobacteria bacterium RIFCSPLOWO2_02_FULL_40_36]OGQ54677.1 MAG: [protein-PII] uridylyltransferase [Deltaproteobacteria bacterium RIFCSPLOWO2_12_FULL_40_28]